MEYENLSVTGPDGAGGPAGCEVVGGPGLVGVVGVVGEGHADNNNAVITTTTAMTIPHLLFIYKSSCLNN
jgi:hypothetical protein